MKNLLYLFLASIFSYGNAQSYNGPESVEYDPITGEYYISNSSNGQILKWDGVALTLFVSNVGSGPHGLEIVNNTLYACSGGRLKGFDLIDGTEVLNYNLDGSFLNGISHSNGQYISFELITVMNFIILKWYIMMKSTNAGGMCTNLKVDLSMSSYASILNTGLGNLDGITMDNCGFFYVSAC